MNFIIQRVSFYGKPWQNLARKQLACKRIASKQRGFTLLEIIVVVFIISTVVVLFGMRLNQDADRVARLEVKRFISVLTEIRDESILTGKPIAMRVNGTFNGYEFLVYKDEAWQPPEKNDNLFKLRLIEKNVQMRFDVFAAVENTTASLLQVTPLGEITPFKLSFIGNKYRYDINLDEQYNLQSTEIAIK